MPETIHELASLCDYSIAISQRKCVSRVATYYTQNSSYSAIQFLEDAKRSFKRLGDKDGALWQRFVAHWKNISFYDRKTLIDKTTLKAYNDLDYSEYTYNDIEEEERDDDSETEDWDQMDEHIRDEWKDGVYDVIQEMLPKLKTISQEVQALEDTLKQEEESLARAHKAMEEVFDAKRKVVLQKIAALKATL